MLHLPKKEIAQIEQTLGESLMGVASELRLIDAADFIAFIRTGQTANLSNLVQSSTELHFKPGTLKLSELAEAELGWQTPPLIILPMEFRHSDIRVYFKLLLAAEKAGVDVESLTTEGDTIEIDQLKELLIRALDDARISHRRKSPADQPNTDKSSNTEQCA